jgi:uncharacterized protein (TIGR03083 family)
MENARYLDCLAEDYSLLRDAVSSADLTARVPSCPGWTMSDLVYHVAGAYLHKVTAMRTGQWPERWPPPELAREPRLALLARAYGELTKEFAVRGPDDPTPTWFDPDQTVAFWIRRMTQETVMHRIDAELAAGLAPTHVPDDLAVDGAEEVLKRFLAYFSPQELATMKGGQPAAADGTETIVVTAGDSSWTVRPSAAREVTVKDGVHGHPQAVIEAAADPMLRWLWGRAGDEVVTVTGDPAWSDYLRRMLAATTR